MQKLIRLRRRSLAVVVAAVASSGCSYNTFVSQEETIKTQWAQVENQLQRRNDLIPNLVETAKGYAQQERDVFGAIADSRAKLAGAQTPEQRMAAANEQSAALARLLVVVENYPDLKSNETFARLMDELAGHREPHRRGADALQRGRPGLQHAAPIVPVATSPRASSASRNTRCSRRRRRPKQVPKVDFKRP